MKAAVDFSACCILVSQQLLKRKDPPKLFLFFNINCRIYL